MRVTLEVELTASDECLEQQRIQRKLGIFDIAHIAISRRLREGEDKESGHSVIKVVTADDERWGRASYRNKATS